MSLVLSFLRVSAARWHVGVRPIRMGLPVPGMGAVLGAALPALGR